MINNRELPKMTSKRLLLLLILTTLFFFSKLTLAWNANGHIVISQLAYEQLTPAIKKKVDQLSAELFKQLPFSTQYQLNNKYPDTSEFAKISTLPDQFRNQPLWSLFEQFQGKLPVPLENIAKQNTRYWHFTNNTYPHQNCFLNRSKLNPTVKPWNDSSQDIIWAINTLKPIVKNEKNLLSQALALAMLTHFIADIHQPLHTFSYVNKQCKMDKGGNMFCLSPSKEGKRCKHNLHHLWDTSVGFLKGRQTNLSRKIDLIQAKFPPTVLKEQLKGTDPSQWAKESYEHAKFIYSIEIHKKPEKTYYQKGQEIAKKQMAIASYRLADTLNILLSH